MNTMKKIEWTGSRGHSIANYATLRKKTSIYYIHLNKLIQNVCGQLDPTVRAIESKMTIFSLRSAILLMTQYETWWHHNIWMNWNPFIDFGYLQYRWVQVILEEFLYMVLQTFRKNTKHTTSFADLASWVEGHQIKQTQHMFSSWWLQPIWKIFVILDHFPR